MGPDEDVDPLARHLGQDVVHFSIRAKTRDHVDLDRKVPEPVPKSLEMLIGEYGGGRQNGDLIARIDDLQSRPHRHLGLAEADVAA